MLHFTYHVQDGYVLSLSELEALLQEISGDTRWSCAYSPDTRTRTMVTIFCVQPPNQISYQFPLMREVAASWDKPENTMVCLHPEVSHQVEAGLYFDGPNLHEDCLRDWDTFWIPIESALRKRTGPIVHAEFQPPPEEGSAPTV